MFRKCAHTRGTYCTLDDFGCNLCGLQNAHAREQARHSNMQMCSSPMICTQTHAVHDFMFEFISGISVLNPDTTLTLYLKPGIPIYAWVASTQDLPRHPDTPGLQWRRSKFILGIRVPIPDMNLALVSKTGILINARVASTQDLPRHPDTRGRQEQRFKFISGIGVLIPDMNVSAFVQNRDPHRRLGG